MRAVMNRRYGGPAQLTIEDVDTPEPGEGSVRIAVRAAGLNALDWHMMRGDPMLVRAMSGLRRPKDPRVGVDLAGVIEAIGPGVTELAVGDNVFGNAPGAFAELAIARARDILPLPQGMSMVDAAALPVAGFTALQALVAKGALQRGHSVLVHGASGGVGHLAVQLARGLGAASVDAVASTSNQEFLRTLGADSTIAYDTDDITARPERYDVIIDTVGTHSIAAMRALLQRDGTLVRAGSAHMGRWAGPVVSEIRTRRGSRPGARVAGLMAHWDREDLRTLATEVEAGRLHPHVSRTYALEGIRDAIAELEGGHVRGKLVVTI